MRTKSLLATPLRAIALLAATAAVLTPSTAAAQTHRVDLIAAEFNKAISLPNGTSVSVPMWGFALDTGTLGTLDGETPTVPGPRIVVPPGTTTLEIYLKNALPADPGSEDISLIIPGQPFDATAPDVRGGRVFSMTPVATPGGPIVKYTFTNPKPGTFLYQSGAHQAVQIQMGLYGALTLNVTDPVAAVPASGETPAVPAVPGVAYSGVTFDNEVVLLYSEIDVALHHAVSGGSYGTSSGPTSTIDYAPSLYLVNGTSYANDVATPPLPGGTAGQSTLLRLLNAGLKSHAPTVPNGTFAIVAEDGNPYPFPSGQATVLLAAGKTHDAIWVPGMQGVYGVYDRLLGLSAETQDLAAGMIAKLAVAAAGDTTPPAGSPVAVAKLYSTSEDTARMVVPGEGLLTGGSSGTAAQLVTGPASGAITMFNGVTGGFRYVPGANFFGTDSFQYRTTNGVGTSAPATVTISVTPVADLPLATAQRLVIKAGESLPVVLGGSDADGDGLSFAVSSPPNPARGVLSRVDPITGGLVPLGSGDFSGTLIYTAVSATGGGTPNFSFVAKAGGATSVAAAVTVTIQAQEAAAACSPAAFCQTVQIVVNGGAVGAFRWTVEEDRTFDVQPGNLDIERTPSVQFHRSYMPVVQSGVAPAMPRVDRRNRYFVSVLPTDSGYSNGGAPIAPNATSVAVTVDGPPGASGLGRIPTAQVRVRVFRDDSPLNGELDGDEAGLPGFAATLEDAGGRYGMSAAQQLMDAFGNPLGTKYKTCSQDVDPGTPGIQCEGYEVLSYGNGFVLTDAEGYALFENLVPGKYGVNVIPPGGQAWQQVTTIEGKKAIDAWVKAKEPIYFAEFGGPAGPHAVIGFTKATNILPTTGGHTIGGTITNLRLSRPPDPSMHSGAPFDFSRPWVALNTGAGIGGSVLYAGPTGEEGDFSIEHVPAGSYTLVVFDSALNVIIASKVVDVGTTDVALGAVPVMQWFTRLYNYVFEDQNEDGFRQASEAGMQEQAINIRFRDGSMYQSAPTDRSGFVPFEEVFPFFAWLIAEVDFTRFKATGVTAVVDEGGSVQNDDGTPADPDWPEEVGAELDSLVLSPQPQSENGGGKFRTETGPVLLEAFQGFIGQSNLLLWGKAPYAPPGSVVTDVNRYPFDDFPGPADSDANGNGAFDGDQFHGGISGIVHYSTTRAENDPRWGGAEVWEPGIPEVRVQLWDATRTRLLNEVTTDSWDASLPEGCQAPAGQEFSYRGTPRDCYDGLRNWNQVRPGVFDGGYAFFSQIEPLGANPPAASWLTPIASRAASYREVPLPAGRYVVKVIAPAGYKVVKEEDKNVDFGMEFIPQQFMLAGYPLGDGGPSDPPPVPSVDNTPLAAPFCVGSLHEVPDELALFPGVAGAYAGEMRPTCDAKLVSLRNGQNPGANFFLFTEAPVAGHITGFVLDDAGNELDPNSPQFGEKFAPSFLPISVRDWKGREITRTYTDAYGVYNALVPSTYTANVPAPSGMSAELLSVCVNSPSSPGGPPDPHFNPKYSHSCFPLPFMPGTTTYLDTPVVPTAAFTGADQLPLDAAFPTQTPVIKQVSNNAAGLSSYRGPYTVDCGNGSILALSLCPTGSGAIPTGTRTAARRIVIQSVGSVQVPNPYYDGLGGTQPKLVTRDYGFGAAATNGVVRLTQRDAISGIPSSATLAVESWSDAEIVAVVPSGSQSGQLTVERCLTGTGSACTEWRESVLGTTLTVAPLAWHLARPPKVLAAGASIQALINASSTLPGDLVLIPPGTYEQSVVLTKPLRLQGWGAAVTDINVVQSPEEGLQNWRNFMGTVLASAADRNSYLLAEQVNILGDPPFVDGILSATFGGEAGGFLVMGRSANSILDGILPNGTCVQVLTFQLGQAYCAHNEGSALSPIRRANARIDGFSIHGASNAAGVMVNGNARFFEISNNRIFNNFSAYAGGIKLGHPGTELTLAAEDANNDNAYVHNNQVTENASLEGFFAGAGGGGIVIGTGTPGYLVQNNWIAGNFTAGQGGGIAHNGLSPNAVINRNTIIFNESFNQSLTVSGGGVSIAGLPPTGAAALSPGSGAVQLSNNLIQGNQAAAGDGGGVSLSFVNGLDLTSPTPDYRIDLFNNVIADNVAAFAGGGIALQDAVNVRIVHNTIVHNDSLATAGAAFAPGSPLESTPQPAGIVSREHVQTLPPSAGSFSSPLLRNSIVWENRSFYFGEVSGGIQNPGDPAHTFGLINAPSGTGRTSCDEGGSWQCWDLGVVGTSGALSPLYSVLTSTSGYDASNSSTAPEFVAQYVNVARKATALVGEAASATILVPAAFDEGGNFIRPQFGPLSLTRRPDDVSASGPYWSNYHVLTGTGGQDLAPIFSPGAVPGAVLLDFDAEARPAAGPHRGADQKLAAPAPATPVPTRR